MPPRLLHFALIGALLLFSGVHIAVLQSFAWARMAARSSLNRPCGICLSVEKASQSGASLRAAAQRVPEALPPSFGPRLASRVAAWRVAAIFERRTGRDLGLDPPPPKDLPS